MSKPLLNSMEEGSSPPPTFEETMRSEVSKQGAAYPQQEAWSPAGKHAADSLPVAPTLHSLPVAPTLLVSEQSFLVT